MIPVEITKPTWRKEAFEELGNEIQRKADLETIQEVREATHIKEYAAKARAER
ncbi:hypothetical protein SESBI_33155 [Sesbania bispinosa]|nr:hypothetical protein SESBI_33155 [Sesbania bispinosa]